MKALGRQRRPRAPDCPKRGTTGKKPPGGKWGRGGGVLPATASAAPAAAPVPSPAPVPAAAPAVEEGLYITAPVVGTFYVAPSPDQPPFVQVGDKVQKGQTVCLMEAMKMMNEVKAPCDCIIEAVLQQDGALVSFGDQLIRYREG